MVYIYYIYVYNTSGPERGKTLAPLIILLGGRTGVAVYGELLPHGLCVRCERVRFYPPRDFFFFFFYAENEVSCPRCDGGGDGQGVCSNCTHLLPLLTAVAVADIYAYVICHRSVEIIGQ